MKKIIYILIFIVLSCNNRQDIGNNEIVDNEENVSVNNEIINDGLSIEMIGIIKDMISFYDTVNYGVDSNILTVDFKKEKENCYFIIFEDICYHFWLQYYTIFNNKLIAFYNVNECSSELIDTTKLNKFSGIPLELLLALEFDSTMSASIRNEEIKELKKNMTKIEGFANESNYKYDPIGRKYKIHNKDSLELVFTGFL